MELSLQKFNNEIKEIRCERDKALQQLARLKQHLLEKVACSLQIFSHSLSPPFFCFFSASVLHDISHDNMTVTMHYYL